MQGSLQQGQSLSGDTIVDTSHVILDDADDDLGGASSEHSDNSSAAEESHEICQTAMPHTPTANLYYQAYQQQQMAAAFVAAQQHQTSLRQQMTVA